ncbi:non-heme iron oxygenase ferredoxin subunit [Herpetosiphon gulosus]|uniref:3-phenylpropionate/cinnamic acid dioxygenase ferredoxin subunit n=1 Tax=Herpetosiphon gulosus TaxID=1973496 RepID=A0ABP9WWS9_9CHLR
MSFHVVATLQDLVETSAIQIDFAGEQVGIFRCGTQYFATSNICTHAYAELHEGELDVDDCTIECPLHGARFDLASGRPRSLPATEPLKVYNLKIEGDQILLEA